MTPYHSSLGKRHTECSRLSKQRHIKYTHISFPFRMLLASIYPRHQDRQAHYSHATEVLKDPRECAVAVLLYHFLVYMTMSSHATTHNIYPARTPSDYEAATALFEAYATWLDIDLSFQNFTSEVANLAKIYGPPDGELLLARLQPSSSAIANREGAHLRNAGDGDFVGCVALRPLTCLLYTSPSPRDGLLSRMPSSA